MKQTVFLLVLFSVFFQIFSLFADMTLPEAFLPETGFKINDKAGIDNYEGVSYFTFLDYSNTIMLGKTTDWQDFEIVATSYSVAQGFEEPVIKVKNENEIYIAYSNLNNGEPLPQTFLLRTSDGGDNFTRTQIGNSGTDSPFLNVLEDEIEITCYEGWQEHLGRYESFTYYETSENVNYDAGNGILPYRGTDVCWGSVHSNDDIWIMQGGGGNNDGWPTFYNCVSTAGRLRLFPSGALLLESGAPIDDIFRGGYQEEVAIKNVSSADALRAGAWLFNEGDFDICYVDIEGSSADVYKGTITSHVEEFPVYSWYPADENWVNAAIDGGYNWFEDAEVIATNYVTIYDTIWVESSVGVGDGQSYFVPSELWIKGEVAGNQCWGSSDNVRIIGDITYTGTDIGQYPDGLSGIDYETNEPEYEGPVNTQDYFGLVSEKSIYIAYKNYHPNGYLETPNVEGGTNNHVYLYGAYAAIGVGNVDLYGDDAPYYDGQFTFEYQHPHGSTPSYNAISPYTGADTLYKYIDLHKYIYPIDVLVEPEIYGFNLSSKDMHTGNVTTLANGYPNYSANYANSIPNIGPNYIYPNGTDYPWYNPVWPEAVNSEMFERGTINLYGSIAQRRKGFTHRSGSDPVNHQNAIWDREDHLFGGTHASTGYDKDYFNDSRLETVSPKNFPYIINDTENKVVTYSSTDNGETFSVSGEHQFTERSFLHTPYCIGNDEWKIFVTGEYGSNIYFTNNNWQSVTALSFDHYVISLLIEGNLLFIKDNDGLRKYDLVQQDFIESVSSPFEPWEESSFLLMGQNPISISLDGESIIFSYSSVGDLNLTNSYSLPLEGDLSYVKDIKSYKNAENELIIFIDLFYEEAIYTHGSIDGLTDSEDAQLPKPDFTLSNHPNPFNPSGAGRGPSTEIRFTAKKVETAKIEIYNIKGQRIREFKMENVKSKMNKITWNGSNNNNHPVASGIYYYTLKLDGKVVASRKMVILK